MANVQGRQQSMFAAYCIKFRRNLRSHRDALDEYLEFHEYWAPMRKNTIEKLETLKRSANQTNTSHRSASVATKAFAVAGNVAFGVGCLACPLVAVGGKALATVASGAGAGISAAAANTMSDIREEAWRVLSADLTERQALIELGLQYNEIVEAIEDTILELKNTNVENFVRGVANVAYAMSGVKRVIDAIQNGNVRRGHLTRDVVVELMDFFRNNAVIEGASEIIRLCRKFVRTNPEAANAAQCAISVAFDVYCLTELMREYSGILDVFGGGMLAHAANGIFVFKDCYDILQIWCEGVDRKCVTENQIEDVLKFLKDEYNLLEKNYNKLREFAD